MGRSRSPSAWRRRFVKKMKRRALKFMDDAETAEDILAWNKVANWCQSILGYSVMRENGDLGLYHVSDEIIYDILKEKKQEDNR